MAYARTCLERLEIRNYRSIEHIELNALPDLVVLHGPNGSGKSNLLRAARLLVRAAAQPQLPATREDAWQFSLQNADAQLDLRPDDFRRGATPEFKIAADVRVGTRGLRTLAIEGLEPFTVHLEVIAQLVSDTSIKVWFPRVEAEDGLGLWGPSPGARPLLLGERFRLSFLKTFLLTSDAERRIDKEPLSSGGAGGLQKALVQASLSDREEKALVLERLGRALGRVKLFGPATPAQVSLRAAQSESFGEYQLKVKPPGRGEIPVRNLGSGEQQVVMMLAQQMLEMCPVVQMEEPEAHLHRGLMEPLADYLASSVLEEGGREPDVDQLWIATHHHYFALAPGYLDVALVDGKTTVTTRRREEAPPRHFYEPGPFWDALKALLHSGIQEGDVIYTDSTGRPVTAGELRKAIADSESLKDGESFRLAREFVAFANQTLIASLDNDPGGSDALCARLPGRGREHAADRALRERICARPPAPRRDPDAPPEVRRGEAGRGRCLRKRLADGPQRRRQRPRDIEGATVGGGGAVR